MKFSRIFTPVTASFFALNVLADTTRAIEPDIIQIAQNEPAEHRGFLRASKDTELELGLLFGGITYLGLKEWDWGSAKFKFNGEGWFGMNTGSGGADKLGHLYSTYTMTEFLAYRMENKGYSTRSAALYSAYAASALMLYVEVFDGFSQDHGFSHQDLAANTLGAGISYLKTAYPNSWGDTLDLRIEYSPSEGMNGFHPITDYSGMKYLAVAKLNGFDALKHTPLKYLELQLGYFTRGFSENDLPFEDSRTTETFFGVGLNLNEVLFKPNQKRFGKFGRYAGSATHYIQVPGISHRTSIHERDQPLTRP